MTHETETNRGAEDPAKIFETIEEKIWNVEYGENIVTEWLVAPNFRTALDKAESRIETWLIESRIDRAFNLLTSEQKDEAEEREYNDNQIWQMLTPLQREKEDNETRAMYAVSKIELAGETDA